MVIPAPRPAKTAGQDIMAQAVFLAQLEACRGKCTCNPCRILRKASAAMSAQFLQEPAGDPAAAIAGYGGSAEPTDIAEEA